MHRPKIMPYRIIMIPRSREYLMSVADEANRRYVQETVQQIYNRVLEVAANGDYELTIEYSSQSIFIKLGWQYEIAKQLIQLFPDVRINPYHEKHMHIKWN